MPEGEIGEQGLGNGEPALAKSEDQRLPARSDLCQENLEALLRFVRGEGSRLDGRAALPDRLREDGRPAESARFLPWPAGVRIGLEDRHSPGQTEERLRLDLEGGDPEAKRAAFPIVPDQTRQIGESDEIGIARERQPRRGRLNPPGVLGRRNNRGTLRAGREIQSPGIRREGAARDAAPFRREMDSAFPCGRSSRAFRAARRGAQGTTLRRRSRES